MTAQYRFLDEVGIGKQSTNKSYTSKWWFYGTRSELEAWLPTPGGIVDFSYLDSTNTALGKVWAPSGYKIKDVRATALDRFEWDITVSAENTTFGANFQYPHDKTNLASKTQVNLEKGSFTITDEMAGYKWDASGLRWEDLLLTGVPKWVLANDCPFTVRPSQLQINVTQPVTVVKETVFLSGAPSVHTTTFVAFKGIQTLQSQVGRVIESRMGQVNDSEGGVFTQWDKAIMMPPPDNGVRPIVTAIVPFVWNATWKGL